MDRRGRPSGRKSRPLLRAAPNVPAVLGPAPGNFFLTDRLTPPDSEPTVRPSNNSAVDTLLWKSQERMNLMVRQRRRRWMRTLCLACGGGALLQIPACSIDPDLFLQAATQFMAELAIFATENALINLR